MLLVRSRLVIIGRGCRVSFHFLGTLFLSRLLFVIFLGTLILSLLLFVFLLFLLDTRGGDGLLGVVVIVHIVLHLLIELVIYVSRSIKVLLIMSRRQEIHRAHPDHPLHHHVVILHSTNLFPPPDQPIIIINIYALHIAPALSLVSTVIANPGLHAVLILHILLLADVIRLLLHQRRYVRPVLMHLVVYISERVFHLYLVFLQLYADLGFEVQDLQVRFQAIVTLQFLRVQHVIPHHLKLLHDLIRLVLVTDLNVALRELELQRLSQVEDVNYRATISDAVQGLQQVLLAPVVEGGILQYDRQTVLEVSPARGFQSLKHFRNLIYVLLLATALAGRPARICGALEKGGTIQVLKRSLISGPTCPFIPMVIRLTVIIVIIIMVTVVTTTIVFASPGYQGNEYVVGVYVVEIGLGEQGYAGRIVAGLLGYYKHVLAYTHGARFESDSVLAHVSNLVLLLRKPES